MKKIISLSLIIFCLLRGGTAFAERVTLLDCNVYSGEFQQITVYQEADARLTLYRLNSAGYAEETPLPTAQWTKQKLSIPCPRSRHSCGYVYNSQGGWVYSLGQAGFMSHGFCR